MAILWDIENCPIPSDIHPEDVAINIRITLRVHLAIDGSITMFSAYSDFNAFLRRLREGCQRTGFKLIDVPNGRKDAAEKAILVDMFLFAIDNPPPSSIMLISGDVDFAPALHVLGQRGFVWHWPSVARGEGFVLPAQSLIPPRDGLLMGCQDEEESIAYKGISRGDLNCLKGQLVNLLELFDGIVPLTRLPAEYQKTFGKPLFVSEYRTFKLVNLIKKMNDAIGLEGKGQNKFVCLRNTNSGPICPPVRKDKKGKECRDDNDDVTAEAGSSDEFSDDERVVIEVNDDRYNMDIRGCSQNIDQSLNKFKCELQEILVSCSCRIFLGCFEAIYQQRYKREMNYESFGVNSLEELLEKVKDVVILQEEPM
ncbi:hypothetical protein BUALT_Bualt19G0109000 [Buddleja alternifolia]|uniref:HTH OST-type domain-containing protein n=1 Tax=Buddleja alternifolia TaxID=168488 RepID=A0AAV6W3C6_9LAMI|nr:hypothetical protein BUALT_Bualt19G0109000 [Buddleja alternifolia]